MSYGKVKSITPLEAKRMKVGSRVIYREDPLKGTSEHFDLTLGKEYILKGKYESPRCGPGAIILDNEGKEFEILFSLLGKP